MTKPLSRKAFYPLLAAVITLGTILGNVLTPKEGEPFAMNAFGYRIPL